MASMLACYDLARCPPTYDAVAFLALVELERLRRGDECIDLRILPGPAAGFRADGLGTWPHSVEERVQVRDDVLVPLCKLLPSARSVAVEPARCVDGWGRGESLVGLPSISRALRSGSRPLRMGSRALSIADKLLAGVKYITFTLREASHHRARNSYVPEWVRAAAVLEARGLPVVVIRDSLRAQDELPGCKRHSSMASVDLDYRAAYYSQSMLNVGISNGPMWMSVFMDAPTLMLRPTANELGGCYDDAFFERCGIPRGAQLPASPPHQRLVWESDGAEVIAGSVEDMLRDLAN